MTDYRLISMRRLIKYWGRRAEEQSGIMIVCMVMVFFFGLIFKSGSSLSAMLDTLYNCYDRHWNDMAFFCNRYVRCR